MGSLCEVGRVESVEVAGLVVGDQQPVVRLLLLHLKQPKNSLLFKLERNFRKVREMETPAYPCPSFPCPPCPGVSAPVHQLWCIISGAYAPVHQLWCISSGASALVH